MGVGEIATAAVHVATVTILICKVEADGRGTFEPPMGSVVFDTGWLGVVHMPVFFEHLYVSSFTPEVRRSGHYTTGCACVACVKCISVTAQPSQGLER